MGEPISYYVRKYIEEGIDFVAARVVSTKGSAPRHRDAIMLMREDGMTVGTVGGGLLEAETEKLCRQLLQKKEGSLTHEFMLDEKRKELGALEMGCGGDAVIQIDYISAADPGSIVEDLKTKDRAYIFGGGHVAQELVPVLSHVGFRCVVMDDREEFTKKELFPGAEEVICGDLQNIADYMTIGNDDYVCVMTRGHAYDTVVQAQVLKCRPTYCGVIGSAFKAAGVRRTLKEEYGLLDEELDLVTTPIGLNIKGETPAEIAISIAAQMILHRAERNGL